MGRLVTADEFGEVIVKEVPAEDGDVAAVIVRLRDVARVELGAQFYDQVCRLDVEPSVGMNIYQLPGSNAIAAAEAVGRGRAAATGGGSGPAIDAGNEEVAVEGAAGVLGGDVKIGRAIGRNDKSEAFGMELDGAGDEIGIAGGDVVVLPNPSERAVLFEGVESTGDGGEGDAETFGEGGWIERGGFFALEKSKEAIGQAAGGRHRFELRMIPRFDETPILSR